MDWQCGYLNKGCWRKAPDQPAKCGRTKAAQGWHNLLWINAFWISNSVHGTAGSKLPKFRFSVLVSVSSKWFRAFSVLLSFRAPLSGLKSRNLIKHAKKPQRFCVLVPRQFCNLAKRLTDRFFLIMFETFWISCQTCLRKFFKWVLLGICAIGTIKGQMSVPVWCGRWKQCCQQSSENMVQ